MDGGTTDAASECGGLESAARVEGRGWRHAAGQGISVVDLTSSREMEGERGFLWCTQRRDSDGRHPQQPSLFWYHRGGRYPQTAWCDSCNLLSAWRHPSVPSGDPTALGGPPAAPLLPANVMQETRTPPLTTLPLSACFDCRRRWSNYSGLCRL